MELGAGGLLFDGDCEVRNGESLTIRLAWPLPAQGICPVVLIIRGTVVRIDERGIALRMRDYGFQMEEENSHGAAMPKGGLCNVIG